MWTFESLLYHLDQRFLDLETRIAEANELKDNALVSAQSTVDERLKTMNEFRQAIEDIVAKCASKEAVATLEKRLDRIEGQREGLSMGWGFVVALFVVIGSIAAVVAIVVAK